MEKLKELVSLCRASVSLSINDHKDYYQRANDYLHTILEEEIDQDIWQKMVQRDCIIRLQFYPHTPIGSYVLYHYDLDEILDQALELIKE